MDLAFLKRLGLPGGVFWAVWGRWAGRGRFLFKVVLKLYHFGAFGRIWPSGASGASWGGVVGHLGPLGWERPFGLFCGGGVFWVNN